MSQNSAYNPITSLMDVESPEIKRANWNNDHSVQLTSDVLYVKPVLTDHILPNTRVKLDIDQASFANPTISPLYGRYKVKYLAFFSPYRLYVKNWRNNSTYTLSSITSTEDDKKLVYPVLDIPIPDTNAPKYVAPTSLGEYLGAYPAYFQNADWSFGDMPEPSTAFSFLSFWDIFRHYIANQQEDNFYVRTTAFKPSYTSGLNSFVPSTPFNDTRCSRSSLDKFFNDVLDYGTDNRPCSVCGTWKQAFGFDPIFANKDVATRYDPETAAEYKFVRHEFHYGLPIAPFSPDPFTSWLDNEQVELEQTTSKMIVDNNSITMDQWRVANATQQKMRKYLYHFGDFGDFIDSQYGVRPSTSISKPMFLGMFQSDIVFNDVVSTAQTGDDGLVDSNTVLGSRAGYGHGTDRGKQNFIDFTAEEFGVLQILQIIIPEVFYYEGRDLQYTTHSYDEEFNPTMNIGLLQDLERQQLNLVPNRAISSTGTSISQFSFTAWNKSIGKQPYGMQHICKTNRLHGMMTMDEYYKTYSLARSFNGGNLIRPTNADNRGFYSSYGYPEMFNQVFANNQGIDNFQFYLSFNYTKYNVVLKKFIPFT